MTTDKDIRVLQKIRQEIKDIEDFEIVYGCLYVRYYDVDKIIDKYIKKSEVKNDKGKNSSTC